MFCEEFTFKHFNISLLNPQQLKEFGVKFRLREIGRIFLTKIRNSKLWKMPKISKFQRGDVTILN